MDLNYNIVKGFFAFKKMLMSQNKQIRYQGKQQIRQQYTERDCM